jgi:hypothetical protein
MLLRARLHAYVALVFLACVVTAVIVVVMLPRERVTRANYDKIRTGMSEADLLRLLGPPDFEKQVFQNTLAFGPVHVRSMEEDRGIYRQWVSPKAAILVIVDDAGTVVHRNFIERGLWSTVWSWVTEYF